MFGSMLTVGIIFFLTSNLLLFLALSHLYMAGPTAKLGVWGIGAIAVIGGLLLLRFYYRSLEESAKSCQFLTRLSEIDETTGLNSERYFLERFRAYLKGLKEESASSALLLIQIDFFKNVNAPGVRVVGDRVLRHAAKVVTRQLRDDDLIGRYGGGAFAVMLPRIRSGAAYGIAERIRAEVAQHPCMTGEGGRIEVTVSIGVTEAFAGKEALQIIGDADTALSRAESKGGNSSERFEAAVGTGG